MLSNSIFCARRKRSIRPSHLCSLYIGPADDATCIDESERNRFLADNIAQRPFKRKRVKELNEAHLLSITRLDLLTLIAVNESRGLVVEAVQAMGFLVHKGIVLRNKLPSDF